MAADGKIIHIDFRAPRAEVASGVVHFDKGLIADNVVSLDAFKTAHPVEVRAEHPPENIEKLQHFTALVSRGITRVVANSVSADVIVPEQYRNNYALALNFSHRFDGADMKYDIEGVRATLSFNNERHHITLPWHQVWQIYSPNEGVSSMRVWKAEFASNAGPSMFDV